MGGNSVLGQDSPVLGIMLRFASLMPFEAHKVSFIKFTHLWISHHMNLMNTLGMLLGTIEELHGNMVVMPKLRKWS